ncbi:MAG: hypothetical protein ACRCZF_14810, partial [Gemmataceae bacterium]
GEVIATRTGGDHVENHPPDHHTNTPQITTRSHKVLQSNGSPLEGFPLEGSPPDFEDAPKAVRLDSSTEECLDAEILGPQPVKGEGQSDSAESQIVKTKSAAAPKVISKSKFLNDFYMLYNELRPELWPRVTKSTEIRERGIDRLLRSCNNDREETLKTLSDSLNYCRQDQWWGSKSLGLDTLFSKDYLISTAERWEVIQSTPGAQRAIETLSDPKRAQFHRDLSIGMDRVREIEARRLAEMAAANGDDF